MRSLLIMGLGKSGLYAALLGIADGRYHLVICDDKNNETIMRRKEIVVKEALKRRVPVSIYIGENMIPDFSNVEMAVVSPGVSLAHPYLTFIKQKGAEIISELEFAYRYIRDERDKIIGITGTNGKTTTVLLLSHILKGGKRKIFTGGNIGDPLSKYVLQEGLVDHIVLEISSFQLEAIRYFSVGLGAILNIDEDHLDRHGSLNEYASLKFRIFKNAHDTDWAVLNKDDRIISHRYRIENLPSNVAWFSVGSEVPLGAYMDKGWLKVKLSGAERAIVNYSNLSDEAKFNLENIMAAALIASILDIPSETIRKAINTFRFPPHRMEYVGEYAHRKVYNDSKATNPHAVKKALSFLHEKVILIMGGYGKNFSFSSLKPVVERKVKILIAYGEAADKIIEDLKDCGITMYKIWKFEDAVRMAWSLSTEGDTILLSPGCASYDQFKSYEERGERFKELILEFGVQ